MHPDVKTYLYVVNCPSHPGLMFSHFMSRYLSRSDLEEKTVIFTAHINIDPDAGNNTCTFS
jgi:hypothetical protein